MEKEQVKAGVACIFIGALFLVVPYLAMRAEIDYWWLALVYPVAVLAAGLTKIAVYSNKHK